MLNNIFAQQYQFIRTACEFVAATGLNVFNLWLLT
jgi:hypothetical protein